MAEAHIVDLDDALISWAMDKLGSDYTVEKVDASKVEVEQKAVLYQSTHDWWFYKTVEEEIFDNNEGTPATWTFSEAVTSENKAEWTLIKALKSSKVLPMSLCLEYPVSRHQEPPLKVEFDCSKLSPTYKSLEARGARGAFNIEEDVTIEPYMSSRVCAQLQVCELNNVTFTSDILMSGSIRVQGHKKNKKWTRHELTASIVDALAARKALGFSVIENVTNPEAPARQVAFRVEGTCTGEVATESRVTTSDIVTSV